MKDAIKAEYEPVMLRAYMVALERADELQKDSINTATGRLPALIQTANYLRGTETLPSLLDPHARVGLSRRGR